MMYQSLRETVKSKGKFIPYTDQLDNYISNEKDWYVSLFQYTEEQKNQALNNNTVSGIKDTSTNNIYFDFDSKEDVNLARLDTITVAHRLIEMGIEEEGIQVWYSGKKGYALQIKIKQRITPQQFKYFITKIAGDLKTFDITVSDPNRIIRIPNTKHQESGLYKIPLELYELDELSVEDIKKLATKKRKLNTYQKEQDLSFFDFNKEVKSIKASKEVLSLDWSNKPKFLTSCRWALQNGLFEEGSRSTAFLCLAATYKNLGFDIQHVYRLLKGVAELQSNRTGCDRFPDNEIYNNVCLQVFQDGWKNGQYTCRESDSWLGIYCKKLGEHKCNHKIEDDMKPKTISDIRGSFKEYVKHIDENTIITGIPSIDNNVFLSTGANVGIIGAAGSGKTSIGLEILNNTSKAGVKSVCASLDMAKNRFFEKVMYRVSGLSREDLYHTFQMDEEEPLMQKLKNEFGNVNFFNKSSPTVQDLKEYIINCQEQNGEKIKLVVLDYFERVSSDIGDDTAASKRVAGELQDLVNDLDICLVTLVQPNKAALSGGADQPIYDYTKIKGSSFVYQAFRIIMSCWRPFYHPKDFTNDHYMQMAVLKNDLGELNEFYFMWNGKKGSITEMDDFQRDTFLDLLKEKDIKSSKENYNGLG